MATLFTGKTGARQSLNYGTHFPKELTAHQTEKGDFLPHFQG